MCSGTSKTIGRGLVEYNCAEDIKSTLKWLLVRRGSVLTGGILLQFAYVNSQDVGVLPNHEAASLPSFSRDVCLCQGFVVEVGQALSPLAC